ncbi:Clp protease N-terminal domain-containing protein [Mariniluteicoccus flavus]
MTRPTLDDFLVTYAAAATEAARLRHAEVDIDHLLLGLLAAGGEPARRLAAQGVTLAAARGACVRLQGEDLGALGITAPDTTDATSTASELADRVAGLRLTPRAEQALPRHRDGDLLEHLLRDDRVRRGRDRVWGRSRRAGVACPGGDPAGDR